MDKVIFTIVTSKKSVSDARRDDDFADRLNSRYTPIIFILFTVFATVQQIVRNPITCWAPVHFTDSHIKYANWYCWIRNTYYLPFEEVNIPHEGEWRQLLRYYQYIQFVLLGQAICFYLPTLVWRAFNSKAGVDADNILSTALGIPDIKKAERREGTLKFLSNQIDRFLESRTTQDNDKCQCDVHHILSGLFCRCCGKRVGNYLVILYMFQKLLFLLNIVLQFVALGLLLGEQFWIYGAKMVADPVPDDQWSARGFVAFPRVTLCDFKVRRLGNLHRYTLQCVLPLNLFIEKMYIFLWFWMIFVLAVTVFYFVVWSMRFIWRKDRLNFITNHLKRNHRLYTDEATNDVDKFVDNYLRQDGVFLLRLIATNTNYITTGDIICAVWDFWCDRTGRQYDPPTPALTNDSANGDEKPLLPPPHHHTGLKWRRPRKKKPGPEAEKPPKKTDLSRVPTLYVRGSDTIGLRRPRNGSYPNDDSPTGGDSEGKSSNDWDEPRLSPQPSPASSAASLPRKEAIPMDDMATGGPDEVDDALPQAAANPGGIYPNILNVPPPVPQPRLTPSAPPSTLDHVADTAV